MENIQENEEVIDELIKNPKTKMVYRQGLLLGKGGFANCYEFQNITTKEKFAVKVISKQLIRKLNLNQETTAEMRLHNSLRHENIVAFHSQFSSKEYLYIVLEMCQKGTLRQLYDERKILTLVEVRYFMKQIVSACKYMHDNKVVHRDLKLENILITENMIVKVCDFGFAVSLNSRSSKKRKRCGGTLLYMSPEVISSNCYGYKADIWSLGCIMYTLLVGFQPFLDVSVKDSKRNIKQCNYYLPGSLDLCSLNLIQSLLDTDPEARPNSDSILSNIFFVSGFIPPALPTCCLFRQPKPEELTVIPNLLTDKENSLICTNHCCRDTRYLNCLQETLRSAMSKINGVCNGMPAVSISAMLWITEWTELNGKNGVICQFSDFSIGVLSAGGCHLTLKGKYLFYRSGSTLERFEIADCPLRLIELVNFIQVSMPENFERCNNAEIPSEGADLIPWIRAWFRSRRGVSFYLAGGVFQTNFNDNSKIVLDTESGAIILFDEQQHFLAYTFRLIERYGSFPLLASCLRYAYFLIERLLLDMKSL